MLCACRNVVVVALCTLYGCIKTATTFLAAYSLATFFCHKYVSISLHFHRMQNLDQSGDSLLHLPSPNSPDSSTVVEVCLTLHVKVLSQGQSMLRGCDENLLFISTSMKHGSQFWRAKYLYKKLALKLHCYVNCN